MLAITQKNIDGHSVLSLTELPTPTPGPEQLLIRVRATAVNRADLLQRRGKYPPPPGESDIMGLEIAGEVEAVGKEVKQFHIGQRVFGLVGSGGYADHCLIDQGVAIPIPEGISYVEAAAIPEAFLTANEAVVTLGQLQTNQTILIHAGGSGIGTAAIQLAHQLGAHVFATSSAEKMERVYSLGASAVIDYKTKDFVTEILTLTNGEGVDVIIDFIGASYLERNLKSLKSGGRLICVGLLGGATAEINLRTILDKHLQIKGLIMRKRSIADKRAMTERFCKQWLSALMEAKIHPVIDTIYPLAEVAMAHQHMEDNLNVGKIVLRVD